MAKDPEPETLPAAPTEGKSPSVRRGSGRWLTALCLVLPAVHPLAWFLARHVWLADLLCHFQEPALVVTLLASAVALTRHRKTALGLAVLAAFQAAPLVRYSGRNPVAPAPDDPSRLRILLANVLHTNRRYDPLERLIQAERPDVVALVEYDPGWHSGLAKLRDEFPYRCDYAAGASGLALWFRSRPVDFLGPVQLVPNGFPVLRARFLFGGRLCNLLLVHPTSPLWRVGRAGNPEVDAIAREADWPGPTVILGDMNSTDGSPHFHDFLRVSGLRDSRYGFGRQPTWPAQSPYRIAIDHAFVSRNLAVADRRLGPDIGSDHLPVILDLAPEAATSPETRLDQASRSWP